MSGTGTVDLDEVIRQVKIIARRQATARQRTAAQARARRSWEKMSPTKRAKLKRNEVRYLAVATERDDQSLGSESVMIWDTYSQEIVANEVYDIDAAPKLEETAKFDTFAAEYVGAGL